MDLDMSTYATPVFLTTVNQNTLFHFRSALKPGKENSNMTLSPTKGNHAFWFQSSYVIDGILRLLLHDFILYFCI